MWPRLTSLADFWVSNANRREPRLSISVWCQVTPAVPSSISVTLMEFFFLSCPLKRTIVCAASPCFIWHSLLLHASCKLISASAAVAVMIENPFNVKWHSGAAHFGTSSQNTHEPSDRLIWAWGSLDSEAKGQREGKREKHHAESQMKSNLSHGPSPVPPLLFQSKQTWKLGDDNCGKT